MVARIRIIATLALDGEVPDAARNWEVLFHLLSFKGAPLFHTSLRNGDEATGFPRPMLAFIKYS